MPVVPVMPAAMPAIPVVITTDAARPPGGPDDAAGRIVGIVVAIAVGVIAAADEDVPMVETTKMRDTTVPTSATMPSTTAVPASATMPAATAVPTTAASAAAVPATTSAANLSGQCSARLLC